MSLLQKLLGITARPSTADQLAGKVMPIIKQTRLEQSMEPVSYIVNGNMRNTGMKRSNFRRLERNKYAPWGRGDLSGLPV